MMCEKKLPTPIPTRGVYMFVRKLLTFFCVVFLIGVFQETQAQTKYDLVTNGSSVKQEITFSSGAGLAPSTSIWVRLPAGVKVESSTIRLKVGAGTETQPSYSIVNSSYFYIATGSVAIPPLTSITISFTRYATCDAVGGSLAFDEFVDQYAVGSNNDADFRNDAKKYYIWAQSFTVALQGPDNTVIADKETSFEAKITHNGSEKDTLLTLKAEIDHVVLDGMGLPLPVPVAISMLQASVGSAAKVSIPVSKITSTAAKTTIEFDSSLLTLIGDSNGKLTKNEYINLHFKLNPDIAGCGKSLQVKVSPSVCAGRIHQVPEKKPRISAPGFLLTSFVAERSMSSLGFPDEGNTHTINGDWRWNTGGSANPNLNYVRSGDTLMLKLGGVVATSSVFAEAQQIHAVITFTDTKHKEFTWSSAIGVKVKRAADTSWPESYTDFIAAPQVGTTSVSYKINAPGGVALGDNDSVMIVIATAMNSNATTTGACQVKVDAYATATQSGARFPGEAPCANVLVKPIVRYLIADEFSISKQSITATCNPSDVTTVTFKSQEKPYVPGGSFKDEFRPNHYAKELQVYVPANGKLIQNGVMINGFLLDGSPTLPLPVPEQTTVSFSDGSKIYENATCYTFNFEKYYKGDYGQVLFLDEDEQILNASFKFTFDSPMSAVADVSAIKYVLVSADPSNGGTVVESHSYVQKVDILPVFPKMTVISPGTEAIAGLGVATWNIEIANVPSNAAALDRLSISLKNTTGAIFDYIEVEENGAVAVVVNEGDEFNLSEIVTGGTSSITIKAYLKYACNSVEKARLTLTNTLCDGTTKEEFESVDLSYLPQSAEIKVETKVPTIINSICDEFKAQVNVTASGFDVSDAKVVLELPKAIRNNTAFQGVSLKSIEYKAGGSYPSQYYRFEDSKLIIDLPATFRTGEFDLVLTLTPTCDFPVDATITSTAYAKRFCSEYNVSGSGKPVTTDKIVVGDLQSSYTANLIVDKLDELWFDENHRKEVRELTIQKTSAAPVTGKSYMSIEIPALLTLSVEGQQVTSQPDGDKVIVTWEVPNSDITNGVTYKLTFEKPALVSYNDALAGLITAKLVNKIAGITCPAPSSLSCQAFETKAGERDLTYQIKDIFPALAKTVTYTAKSLLDYTFTYTFTLKNFGNQPIQNVRLTDNLNKDGNDFYGRGKPSNFVIATSADNLKKNVGYNGKDDINLLAAGSTLPANATQTVTLTFDVKFNDDQKGKTFPMTNLAVLIGSNDKGTDYEDSSNTGTNPEIGKKDPTITDLIDTNTPEVEVVPIINENKPLGFETTLDGVKFYEGNAGDTPVSFELKLKGGKVLDYDLCFMVLTQDGTATASDNDYKPLSPTKVCIKAKKEKSDDIITVNVVGDIKYEKEETLTLAVEPLDKEMKHKPVVITVMNDDSRPNVFIKDVTLADTILVAGIQNFSKLEGTSVNKTKFVYTVTLKDPAPQAFDLVIKPGSNSDSAIKGKDYFCADEIKIPIKAGQKQVSFTIDVDANATPQHDVLFTLLFTIKVDDVELIGDARTTMIIDDDEFTSAPKDVSFVYCAGDDEVAQINKIAAQLQIPEGYQPRWYETQTSTTSIPVPTITTGPVTRWVGWYNPAESYEAPMAKRTKVVLDFASSVTLSMALSKKVWNGAAVVDSVVNTPYAVGMLPGQSIDVSVSPAGLSAYEFTVNGAPRSGSSSGISLKRSDFNEGSNTLAVNTTDVHGCVWSSSVDVNVAFINRELPNAFIPEGSGDKNKEFLNENFVSELGLKINTLRIFNRWGHLLYEGTKGWDGRYKGSYVTPGTYFYVLIVDNNGAMEELKGSVLVVKPTE